MPHAVFLKMYWWWGALAAVLVVVGIYSLANLVTTPKLWIDEAITMEMSRNLVEQGTLDIQVAPREFSGTPQYLQSTGYTVTYPLALVYALFGAGAAPTRIFMLAWLLGTVVLTYLIVRAIFGPMQALGVTLLLTSFASFYADGRTATGELPGFFFCLAGIYFLTRERILLAGLLGGLAVVTKPSIYLLLIPAVIFAQLLSRESWSNRLRTLAWLGVGALAAPIVWIILVVPHWSDSATWSQLFAFFRNPYDETTVFSVATFGAHLQSTTLLYFGVLLGVVALAGRYVSRAHRFLYLFVLFYSFIAFVYYLHSPGWLRYLFGAELLILVLVPHAITVLAESWRRFWPQMLHGKEAGIAVGILVAVQLFQLVFLSDMLSSSRALRIAERINEQPQASVLAFQTLDISTLLKTPVRYNSLALSGLPALNTNPLIAGTRPDFVLTQSDDPHLTESQPVLTLLYQLKFEDNGVLVYVRITQ